MLLMIKITKLNLFNLLIIIIIIKTKNALIIIIINSHKIQNKITSNF